MKVVFAASEVAPFAKTGGLADVAGALPAALADRGVEVTVMLPRYRCVRDCGVEMKPCDPPAVPVTIGPYTVSVELYETTVSGGPGGLGVRVVSVGYDPYFDRPFLYGRYGGYGPQTRATSEKPGACQAAGPPGPEHDGGRQLDGDYPDNAHRFGLFSRAVIEAAGALGLSPDVYHAHDWQTALVCAYLRTEAVGPAAKARSVLTIHNIGYQGVFWKWDLPWTGLKWDLFNPEGVEFFDHLNLLKAGILFADAITTVSPTYAREISSSRAGRRGPEGGRGLEGVLQRRAADLVGIVNGVDTGVWNPATDEYLPCRYSLEDMSGKAECKAALQRECGLPVEPKAPLVGSVGRLTEQKGCELVLDCIEDVLASDPDCQFVFLGSGGQEIERGLEGLASRCPRSFHVHVGFDEELAHRIEAGSDMFLMPSLYEPCGLNQLYSMIYGTIPIVRRTGGLADTVVDSPEEDSAEGDDCAASGPSGAAQHRGRSKGTGFVFDEFKPEALLECIRRALVRYRDPQAWRRLVERAMKGDWSWDKSAREYVKLYESLLSGNEPPMDADGRR